MHPLLPARPEEEFYYLYKGFSESTGSSAVAQPGIQAVTSLRGTAMIMLLHHGYYHMLLALQHKDFHIVCLLLQCTAGARWSSLTRISCRHASLPKAF